MKYLVPIAYCSKHAMKNKKHFEQSKTICIPFENPKSEVRPMVKIPQVTASQPWSSIIPRQELALIFLACFPSVLSHVWSQDIYHVKQNANSMDEENQGSVLDAEVIADHDVGVRNKVE